MERFGLYKPSADELIDVISATILRNFESGSVSECACPDFRKAPWNLVNEGLCGSTGLLDIGDGSNLRNPDNHHSHFSLPQIVQECGNYTNCSILGAGAVALKVTGKNG